MGVSARQPAHRTRPPQPPQPPQQPQPLRRLLPQLQRRPRPAALQAHSPPSTATPASATPSDSTSAAPSPAPAPHRQPQQRRQQPQQQPQQLLQPVRWTPDLLPASLVSFPSHTGTTFSGCAEWVYGGENQGKLWCSTKVDSTGTHVNGEGNYGFCSATCTAVSLF